MGKKLTKLALLELAKTLGDDDELDLFVQDDVNAIVQERLLTESKRTKQAKREAEELRNTYETYKSQIENERNQQEMKGKSELEQALAELRKRDTTIKNWEQKVAQTQTQMEQLRQRARDSFLERSLIELFTGHAANPANAALIARSRLADHLHVNEDNGSMTLKAINPLLQTDMDLNDLRKTFLQQNPDLRRAVPAGSPVGGARPQGEQRTKEKEFDPFSVSPVELMRKGLMEEAEIRQRTHPHGFAKPEDK